MLTTLLTMLLRYATPTPVPCFYDAADMDDNEFEVLAAEWASAFGIIFPDPLPLKLPTPPEVRIQ